MAKLALTAAGMAIGFAAGGPFGAQIGAMIGGMAGNLLFPTKVQGPRLTDLSVSASTYGNAINELYGTMRLSGNVIWSSGIKEHKSRSGGKGSGVSQTTYSYTASFAIAFCKGEAAGINRIWADGKMITGQKPIGTSGTINLADTLNLTKGAKGKFKYRFHSGSEDQMPDETIEAALGAGNVPAYRDLCYLVFIDMPLTDFGNRIPQITAEITRQPVVTAPVINLTSDTTFAPVTTWANATPDFANNKLYQLLNVGGTSYFVTYDLRTMQELKRVQVDPVKNDDAGLADQGPYYFNPCFSIGGNYFWDNTSLHNSGTGEIWDANTGQGLVRIGHTSNSFPASAQPDGVTPYDPKLALIGTFGATCMWLRIVDTSIGGTAQDDYLWQTGNLGNDGIIFDVAGYPVHTLTVPFAAAAAWTPLRGKENPGALVTGTPASSDFILINNQFVPTIGFDVHLKKVNLIALAKMTTGDSPTLVNNIANTEDSYVLPRPFDGDFIMDNCAYDQSDNGIVIWGRYGFDVTTGTGGKWCFVKWMLDESAYKWKWKDTDLDPSLAIVPFLSPSAAVDIPVRPANQSNLNGGTVGWMRGSDIFVKGAAYVADLQTGKITLANVPTTALPYSAEDGWPFNAWDDNTQSILGAPARVFITQQGDGVTLQSIVDDIFVKTQALEVGDWDSSALSGITVHGYAISRETTARDVLMQLAGAYFFDGVESDYKIKMTLRGAAPIATIDEKHLAWVKDKDISVKQTRAQEVELPMRVTVSYADVDRDYQTGTQSAKRNANPFPTMHSHTESKVDLPIVMTATNAKQIADKGLKMSWINRVTYDMKMPWQFLKYDPTDVITVTTAKGNSYEMRLSKMGMGVDFTLAVSGTADIAAAYVSTAVGDPGSGVPSQIIKVGGPVDVMILNTPLLRDTDDTQGVASVFYALAKAKSPGTFAGAYLFESTDPFGADFTNLDRFTTEPTWGFCSNALPPHTHYGIDTVSELTVRIMSLTDDNINYDALDSCTLTDLINGKNAALVGNEIIQFMTATMQPDGRTFKLTNLLRARRGTNYAVPYHAAGETFVLLDVTTMVREVNTPAEWASRHLFKGVATGEFVEDVATLGVTMQPTDLKPYTPECVRCSDDGTNVTIDFERRSRIGNELHDGDGNVPYREGQGSLAHFVYNVYAGKTLADTPWNGGTPDFTGQVPIYSGLSFAPLTFDFALAGITEFVVEIHEVGFVDGFSKIVYFTRERPNDWAITELY